MSERVSAKYNDHSSLFTNPPFLDSLYLYHLFGISPIAMPPGLIGELVSERADLIVAPLTINPERAQVRYDT